MLLCGNEKVGRYADFLKMFFDDEFSILIAVFVLRYLSIFFFMKTMMSAMQISTFIPTTTQKPHC